MTPRPNLTVVEPTANTQPHASTREANQNYSQDVRPQNCHAENAGKRAKLFYAWVDSLTSRYSDKELARIAQCSPSTPRRWREGVSIPNGLHLRNICAADNLAYREFEELCGRGMKRGAEVETAIDEVFAKVIAKAKADSIAGEVDDKINT